MTGDRKERGDSATSRRNPPHVTENDQGSQLQDEHRRGEEVPGLPANASGKDKVATTEEQRQGIDEESMYDRRPEEDKNRPPSSPRVP